MERTVGMQDPRYFDLFGHQADQIFLFWGCNSHFLWSPKPVCNAALTLLFMFLVSYKPISRIKWLSISIANHHLGVYWLQEWSKRLSHL